MEINWVVSLIIGLVLSVPVGIGTNLLTPRIQDWISERALSTRGKRLQYLRKEYERVKHLKDNPPELNITIWRWVIPALGLLLLAISTITFLPIVYLAYIKPASVFFGQFFKYSLIVLYCLIPGSTLLASSALGKLSGDLIRLFRFEKYEKDVLAKIAKMENSSKKEKAA